MIAENDFQAIAHLSLASHFMIQKDIRQGFQSNTTAVSTP